VTPGDLDDDRFYYHGSFCSTKEPRGAADRDPQPWGMNPELIRQSDTQEVITDRGKVKELRAAGKSLPTIAREMGLSITTVARICKDAA